MLHSAAVKIPMLAGGKHTFHLCEADEVVRFIFLHLISHLLVPHKCQLPLKGKPFLFRQCVQVGEHLHCDFLACHAGAAGLGVTAAAVFYGNGVDVVLT